MIFLVLVLMLLLLMPDLSSFFSLMTYSFDLSDMRPSLILRAQTCSLRKFCSLYSLSTSSKDYRRLLQRVRNFLNISTGIILLFIALELNSSQSFSLLFVYCLLFCGSFYSWSDWTYSSQSFRIQAGELHQLETIRMNLFRKVLFDHFCSAS